MSDSDHIHSHPMPPSDPLPAPEPAAAEGEGGGPRRDTARRVLDAAEEVFAEVGFDAATTAAIAERAGITKALVHYYFRTKESLHREVLDRYKRELSETLVADLDHMSPEAALCTGVRRYCAFLARNPRYVRLCLDNVLTGCCSMAEFPMYRQLVEVTTRTLARGIRAGVFWEEDPRHLIVSIDALCSHFFVHERMVEELWGDDGGDREHLLAGQIEHVVRMVQRAITKPGRGAGCSASANQ